MKCYTGFLLWFLMYILIKGEIIFRILYYYKIYILKKVQIINKLTERMVFYILYNKNVNCVILKMVW